MSVEEYPRYVTLKFKPFDPLKLGKCTEELVCRDSSRKYTAFYCVGVYGGIATGYAVGCCLRCIFCWVDWSRDFPERHGRFYSPQEVAKSLISVAESKGVKKLRISGGEPTLSKQHLLQVLDILSDTDYFFILETNGIILGYDQSYINCLKKYKNIHVRVSLKAGTAAGFEQRTGARGAFYDLPFIAIKNLLNTGIEFHVACMSDPRLMPSQERENLIRKLCEVGYNSYLEEEICDPYPTSIARLEKAGFNIFKE
jgi:uncharacterized Fe-S cluster-containing radical SAM superfamily protein